MQAMFTRAQFLRRAAALLLVGTPPLRSAATTAIATATATTTTSATATATEPTVIAAASDLRFALTELAQRFERSSKHKLRISYGSSGQLTQQIEQGAPFEMFLSADEQLVYRLAARGLTLNRGVPYAKGRLALFALHGSRLVVDADLSGLKFALGAGVINHFAIPNPEHAPYGRAARAALRRVKLWDALLPRLVLGENAAQAMQFAASGSAQGAIVPLSLALAFQRRPSAASAAAVGGASGAHVATLPAAMHSDEPLHQRLVLMKNAGDAARAFAAFMATAETRALLLHHGFDAPAAG